MKNLMLDIETLGTEPESVILSISAVRFQDNGKTGEEFHADIDIESCVEAGLKIDAATVIWWMGQDDEARAQFTDDRIRYPLVNALNNFTNIFLDLRELKIFAKDPDFDCNLLEDAYSKLNLIPPFHPRRNKMAIRTLSSLRPEYEKNEEFTGVKHNGIDDCKHQIKYVTKILMDLSK